MMPKNSAQAYWPKALILLGYVVRCNAVEGTETNDPAANMPTVPRFMQLIKDVDAGRVGPALTAPGALSSWS